MLFEHFTKRHKVFTYAKKPDTKASYLLMEGAENLFPKYITLSSWGLAPIASRGRAKSEKKVADLKTTFRKNEKSPYKKVKPFVFSSSIWECSDYPIFMGYGDIGITQYSLKTESTKDLIIIYRAFGEEKIEIHLLEGLAEYKQEGFEYLSNYLKQQKP